MKSLSIVRHLGQATALEIMRAQGIRVAIFDVDGVLTDGRLYYTDSGEQLKVFHVHDGHGIVMLRQAGIQTAVISGRSSRALSKRLNELQVDFVFTGCADKSLAFQTLLTSAQCTAEQCSMMGDDVPDLPLLTACGLSFAPANATAIALTKAQFVTVAHAGKGAVREVCDWLLACRTAPQTAKP